MDAIDSVIESLNRNQGASQFFLGAAALLLTAALVYTAFRALRGNADAIDAMRESNVEAKRANDIAGENLHLEQQRTRGANIMLKLDEGTRFHVWARGPSSGNGLRLALVVGSTTYGDEEAYGLVDSSTANAGPKTFHFQRFIGENLTAEGLDGEIGRLVGSCFNDDREPETVSSFLFRVRCSDEPGSLVTYERL